MWTHLPLKEAGKCISNLGQPEVQLKTELCFTKKGKTYCESKREISATQELVKSDTNWRELLQDRDWKVFIEQMPTLAKVASRSGENVSQIANRKPILRDMKLYVDFAFNKWGCEKQGERWDQLAWACHGMALIKDPGSYWGGPLESCNRGWQPWELGQGSDFLPLETASRVNLDPVWSKELSPTNPLHESGVANLPKWARGVLQWKF